MQTALSIAMIAIGLLMFLGGYTKSESTVYRMLVARSRPLWGSNVHVFYVVSGLLVACVGVLMSFGFLDR
ncbi:hypothetical protein Poly21_36670 [Allorhodopirellula heiligendammensis]|uniref:Uncharacterized protein n=1 Tax=Allorhodopirellula heiligendammensis TaxID=2714739 RepID=A0A5C6BXC1_9BACT|nr:hypothetical protein Poly21_36670 [Allorhodopirellula heiligendammensis]